MVRDLNHLGTVMNQTAEQTEITDVSAYMLELGQRARSASRLMAAADPGAKDAALHAIADDDGAGRARAGKGHLPA